MGSGARAHEGIEYPLPITVKGLWAMGYAHEERTRVSTVMLAAAKAILIVHTLSVMLPARSSPRVA